jgi:uncharacterized protein
MQIAIAGHTGFLGTTLKNLFLQQGYQVSGIGREDFDKGTEHLSGILAGKDVVINLAGAPIIRRWTRSYTRKIWNSRISTTQSLVQAMGACAQKPGKFISVSGVNIYTERGIHDENSNDFDMDFLGTLCQEWEKEALKARLMVNTFIARLGVVLAKNGGALPKMALPFKLGAGGKLGSGKQMMSWIHLSDFCLAMLHLIQNNPEKNVFNFTSPYPVSNALFSSTLALVLKRPNFFTVPPLALKILYGEGATVLLNGQHVVPGNLLGSGFRFKFPDLESALRDLL